MQPFDEWAEQEEAVFIVGPERSGTTVMRRTLLEAPSFLSRRSAFETHAFRPGELNKRPLPREAAAYLGSRREAFIAAADAGALSGRSLHRCYFHEAKKHHDTGRLVEKTPEHVLWLADVRAAFPKAHIIIMRRNVRDIVISYRARLRRDRARGVPEEQLIWLETPVVQLLDMLQRVDDAISSAIANWPDAVTCVSYERLIADPARELCIVGARLDMPPADIEEMIERSLRPRTSAPKDTEFPARDAPIGETTRHTGLLTDEEEVAIAAVSFVNLRA